MAKGIRIKILMHTLRIFIITMPLKSYCTDLFSNTICKIIVALFTIQNVSSTQFKQITHPVRHYSIATTTQSGNHSRSSIPYEIL